MANEHANQPTERVDPTRAALWASAFVLAGLIILTAAFGRGVGAYASDVSSVGDLTVLTSRSTVDEDILCVLDGRSDMLLVYRIDNQSRWELQQSLKLSEAFAQAAQGGTQTPRRR